MQITREKWNSFFIAWTVVGVYVFTTAFFWVSGTAPLRSVFYLFFLLPVLIVMPWRKWSFDACGGIYTLAALVFAGYAALSTLWGGENIGLYFKQWLFIAFWLCGSAWVMTHSNLNIQKLYSVLALVGGLFAIVTVVFFYAYKGNSLYERLQGIGLTENSTVVGQIFGVAALIAYMKSVQSAAWRQAHIWFAVAAICTAPVLLSQTRGALLALFLTATTALLIVRPKVSIWGPHVFIVLLSVLVVWLTVDISALLTVRGSALSLRDTIWLELLKRIPEHLLWGLGMELDSRISIEGVGVFHHAHNSWMDILYYSGLCGLVLAVWHLLLLLRSFVRHSDALPVYLWVVYGCINQFSNGSTFLAAPDAEWFMYWVPAGLLAGIVMRHRRGIS